MEIQTTRPYHRDFKHLPRHVQKAVAKQLDILVSNPTHPSLQLKKVQGPEDIFEIRITRGYRITLQIQADVYILRRIGTHDILRTP